MKASRRRPNGSILNVLATLLLAAGAVSCGFRKGGAEGAGLPPELPAAGPERPSITAHILSGTAEVRPTPGSEWRSLKEGEEVDVGTEIRTAQGSILELRFEENGSTVKLDSETLLIIEHADVRDPARPDALHVVINVLQGEITGSFISQTHASTFEVRHPGGEPLVYRPAPGGQPIDVELGFFPSLATLEATPARKIQETMFIGRGTSGLQSELLLRTVNPVIPEPSTWALLGLGAAALIIGRQSHARRSRKSGSTERTRRRGRSDRSQADF